MPNHAVADRAARERLIARFARRHARAARQPRIRPLTTEEIPMPRTLDSFPRDIVDRALEWLGVQLGDREPTDAQIVEACLEIEAIDAAADDAQARAELTGQVARRWR